MILVSILSVPVDLEFFSEAQKLAAQTKDQDDRRHYKNLRNAATARMKEEKRLWEKKKLDNSQNDPSTIWKNVKGWLNWNNSGPPTQLFHQAELVNSPAGLSGTINQIFIDKVQQLRQMIPAINSDPLAKLKESMNSRKCSLTLKPVHPDQVMNILKDLKNSKPTGTDNIDTKIIKLVAEDILTALTHIINLSIRHQEFPD